MQGLPIPGCRTDGRSYLLRCETVRKAAGCIRKRSAEMHLPPELYELIFSMLPAMFKWNHVGCMAARKGVQGLTAKPEPQPIASSGCSESGNLRAYRHALKWPVRPGSGMFIMRVLVKGPPFVSIGMYDSTRTPFARKVELCLQGTDSRGFLKRIGDTQPVVPTLAAGGLQTVEVIDREVRCRLLFYVDADGLLRYTVDGELRAPVDRVVFCPARVALLFGEDAQGCTRGVHLQHEHVPWILSEMRELVSRTCMPESEKGILRSISSVPVYVKWDEAGTVLNVCAEYGARGMFALRLSTMTATQLEGGEVLVEQPVASAMHCWHCGEKSCDVGFQHAQRHGSLPMCQRPNPCPGPTVIPFIGLPAVGTEIQVLDVCQRRSRGMFSPRRDQGAVVSPPAAAGSPLERLSAEATPEVVQTS
eukprot:TRINITY_DN5436_c8_g1_i1.p1 TRINITY_DN5436_c8_g1~~TRINITY_DN5436_c8_g1_i1.p1  ORF type:complete len:441 (+),score=133.41 TRINITY_DN5436_c8_g1_i1:68-1324(+)